MHKAITVHQHATALTFACIKAAWMVSMLWTALTLTSLCEVYCTLKAATEQSLETFVKDDHWHLFCCGYIESCKNAVHCNYLYYYTPHFPIIEHVWWQD